MVGKNFHLFIRTIMVSPRYIVMILHNYYSSDVDKAEILNKHFASVFTQDNGSPAPHLGSSPYPDLLSFETSIKEV